MTTDLLMWLGCGLALVLPVVWFAVSETRRNHAWMESMRDMTRRCPSCQPWGGWYLGPEKPGGGYEVITCAVCDGTGQLPPRTEAA